jgi:hypothetical protein
MTHTIAATRPLGPADPPYVLLTRLIHHVMMCCMTTTVTTTTITSVTMFGLGAIIALVVVLLLIGFLISKEVMSSVLDERAPSVSRVLNVGVIPLIMVFGFIIATKLFPIFS